MARVGIILQGYGKPVGETSSRLIQPGEIIEWDGPLGAWMLDLDTPDGAAGFSQSAAGASYEPAIIRRMRQRTRSAMTVREMQALGQKPASPSETPAAEAAPAGEEGVTAARKRAARAKDSQ